ncbi:hypothetical protein L248_0975 [Schleiferilactobacillus shenzhenensis LY-73]|uniref:Uncharacterized protein n=1 Tax=Schleiferilactobacillus shenzhenensis LY-73 TaxID=1231336 RepID=U4TRB6_9LACO|nr:hypothetical protein L248_0975 [Schleiferilactobacillus shenzhenensis LY-73]
MDLDPATNAFKRVSYSYTDLLTKSIEIDFDDSAAKTNNTTC